MPERCEEMSQFLGLTLWHYNLGLTFRKSAFRSQVERILESFIRAPELTLYKLSDGQVKDAWGLPSDVWSMAYISPL